MRKRHTARDPWTYLVVLDGAIRVRQGGWTGEMSQGDQALLLPDRPFSQESTSVPLRIVTIDFRVEPTLAASDPLPLLGLPAVVRINPDPEWKAMCRRAVETCGPKNRPTTRPLLGRGIADTLITGYLYEGIETDAITVSHGVPVPDWLATVHQKLTSLPVNREISSMNKVAVSSGYSRSHFYSEYLRVFGETPVQTVWNVRLNVAARRLDSDPAVPVSDIASQCAFKSHSHFSQMFHRHFGMSPAQWRKRHLKKLCRWTER
jgi:AraC-like DNA-binding protein